MYHNIECSIYYDTLTNMKHIPKSAKEMNKSIVFTDNYFIISYHLLCDKRKSWSVRYFERYGISKRLTYIFFNYLIENDILYRKNAVGPKSYCMLKKPKALLKLCINHFIQQDKKIVSFITTRDKNSVLGDLKKSNTEIYLVKFSGIRPNLKYVHDDSLYISASNPEFFKHENISMVERELNIHKVSSGGNVFIYLPRYKKFLKYMHQEINGLKYPSDFYSYLDMMNIKNPRGQEQAAYMIEKLKKMENSFAR